MDPDKLSRRQVLLGAAAGAVAAGCAAKDGSAAHPGPTTVAGTQTPSEPAAPAASTTAAPAATKGLAAYVPNGPKDVKAVALTFHGSGDPALVSRLLDAARQEQCPITVFAVGQWLSANPALAKRMLDDGHELANHTFTHPSLGRSSGPVVTQEIDGCRNVLTKLTGGPSRWFRPSGVETRPSDLILARAAQAGYATVVGFDVDPMDYKDPGSATVVSRTTDGLHAGAIVSLHTGHAGTVTAFPLIAAALRDRGLRPVVVADLLPATTRP